MSEELLKIADGLNLMAEGVRTLAEQTGCSCGSGQGNSVENTATLPESETQEQESQEEPQTAVVTIAEVRAVMADKSQEGKSQQVKDLIKTYGAEKLSEVQPEKYQALLADVRRL